MFRAANYSGRAINIAKTTAAHAISYMLSRKYNIPHGYSVAITLGKFFVINEATLQKLDDKSLQELFLKTRSKINAVQQKKNVNILYNTNIEADILQNDCIISGPSTSIHEASLLGKVYITLWPFDKYENEYMPKVSTSENVPELISKIKQLNKDDSLQKEVYSTQLSLANKFINIDSDLSVKNIIEHIIN